MRGVQGGELCWQPGWLLRVRGALLTSALLLLADVAPALAAGHREAFFVPVGEGSIPRGVVASLAQDRAGFLWVATGDGLVRHDGYRFQPRGRDGVEPARANLGWVRAMLGARDGRLWIGTEANGLAVYDPHTDRIQDWLPADQAPPDGASAVPAVREVRALAEAPDGAIWVGSLGGGLLRMAPDGASVQLYRQGDGADSLPDDRVLSLLFDPAGNLWVGTWRGLVRMPAGQARFERVLADGQVQALVQAADGRVWAGTQDGRLWRIAPDGGGPMLIAGAEGAGAVTSLAEAPAGRLWVGRALGVDLHESASGRRIQALRVDPRLPGSLRGKETTALLPDQAGSMWVGSLGGGLMRQDEPRAGLHTLRAPDPDHASLRSLLLRRDGALWAADEGGGIWRFDAAMQSAERWQPLSEAEAAPARPGLRVEAMNETPDGGSWLATAEALHRLDARGRRLLRIPHEAGPVNWLVLDEQGQLWLGGEGGLYRLPAAADRLGPQALERVAGFEGGVIAHARAADGALWFGGISGLFVAQPGAAAVLPVAVDAAAGLGNPVVISLLFARDGSLWLDTAVSGLHRTRTPVRMAPTEATAAASPALAFDRVSERHGAVGGPFGANLLEDARGRIWSQLHVYDPASDRLHAIADAEGRHIGTGWFTARAQLRDGRLVFGGSRGLFLVDPAQYEPGGWGPPLVLAGLMVDGERQPAPAALPALRLAPSQRSFAVEFAALAYQQPQAVRYLWMLEGFDRDWTRSDASLRVASYSNLDPGSYRLRVVALGVDGRPSPQELALQVHVEPAWWQRPQTRAAAALLILLLAWAWILRRNRAWQRQRAELQALVAERTAALELSALTDPLTGLHNRRYLNEQLPVDAARCLRRQPGAEASDLLLFLVDIDHFKQVNDSKGHAAGDAVLVQVAERLRQAFREGDAVVRWGGEEFLVLARDTSRGQAPELAERVRAAVAGTPFTLDDGSALHCSCSLGFAAFPLSTQWPAAVDWPRVLKLADEALYAVKSRGRDGWMGVTRADGESATALAAAAAQPLLRWQAAGGLEVAASATLRA